MKQRKAKHPQPKKVTLLQEQPQVNPFIHSASKQVSAHTKMSTNYTIHSTSQNIPLEQPKTKKNLPIGSKKTGGPSSKGLPTSKSTKKLKINLEMRQRVQKAEESYRQYCLVDQSFVPIVNSDQKKLVENILLQTASSSCDFNYYQKSPSCLPPQLRKRSRSSQKKAEVPLPPPVEKISTFTSMKQLQKEYTSTEVAVAPECEDIGMQYSERKEEGNQKNASQEKQECGEPIISQAETISDLLFKLQFSHLGDEKSFSNLTSNEKDHFSQMLETFITKLKGKPKLKRIDFQIAEEEHNQQPLELPEFLRPPQLEEKSSHLEVADYEELQKLVCLREYRQKNWIEFDTKEEHINTSLLSVVNFLCHLFCHVELEYCGEFIYMIQKAYGLNFHEKYRRITRRIPFTQDRRFKVIDQAVFLNFINESNLCSNSNEIMHYKAVFDAFNQHLEEYRPFYVGNGEQFPWALKMFVSMSEYSISEDSLQIIFLQAKEKMIEWCSTLCGILVDHTEKVLLPGNPLEEKRTELQDKMIRKQLKDFNFEKDGIELYSTQAMHDIAETIYQQLLTECAQQLALF